jgi:hypothetical protein
VLGPLYYNHRGFGKTHQRNLLRCFFLLLKFIGVTLLSAKMDSVVYFYPDIDFSSIVPQNGKIGYPRDVKFLLKYADIQAETP